MATAPAALVFMPRKTFQKLFTPSQHERFADLCRVLTPLPCSSIADPAMAAQCDQAEMVITGWGTPTLRRPDLARFPKLKLVAHIAGTVKPIVEPSVLESGIRVTCAAAANAQPVAEFTLAMILLANKRVDAWVEYYHKDRDRIDKNAYQEAASIGNYGKTIGVVSASRVGRHLLKLLTPFDLRVLLYDPLISDREAQLLGVESVPLDTLLQESDVVTLHAPSLPQTSGMIGQRELSLLRDNAIFINTSRGKVVDHDALRNELQTGRIVAVLDVTDPEPLQQDDPFFDMPNVMLTPHIAGSLGVEIHRMTDLILDEIASFIANGELAHEVMREQWNIVA